MTHPRPCPEGVDLTRALSSGAAPDLQAHLDACATCRRERDDLDRVRALGRDLPDSPLPAPTAARVRAVLLDTGGVAPPASRRFRRWWLALPALALPALALARVGAFRARDESPPSARPQAAPDAQGARRARAVEIPPAQPGSRPAPEVPAPAAPEPEPAAAPAASPAAPRPARATPRRQIALADPATPPAAQVLPAPDARAALVRESERLFETGWSAFRAQDYGAAARDFERITLRHAGDPLAEDAAFWLAMALARTGDHERAAAALASFVERFPGSSRAGEASLKLGWLLLDAGQATRAAHRFRAVLADPSPEVRASARAGLSAAEPAAGTAQTPAP